MINASPFRQLVNILQLWVNIILEVVYKMNWLWVGVFILVGSVYKLGYKFGSSSPVRKAKYILRDAAKIASKDLWKTWKP